MKSFEERFNPGTVEVRAEGDIQKIVGYAAVFNRYSENLGRFVERIAPGAFTRVLNRGDDIQAWYNHSADSLLGSRSNGTLDLRQDEVGLRYEIAVDSDDPDHQRVLAKIRRGDLRGSSFGFQVRASGIEWSTTDQDYPLRTIVDVHALRDVGPVSQPAYPDTKEVGALALRSLAEQRDVPLEDLLEAEDLRSFLADSEETTPEESTQPSETPNVALPPVRRILPPRIARSWWADYEIRKETTHG